MVDVDNFKQYNDRNGHRAGDIALKEVAWILKKATRTSDFVTRYGGEEFAVILTEVSAEQGLNAANRLVAWVAQATFPTQDLLPGQNVTISAGLAEAPRHSLTPGGLIDAADRALYRAKAAGKNRVCIAEDPS